MRIQLYSTGFSSVPSGLFLQGSGWARATYPILSVLIDHPQGRLLFDTGFGTRTREEFAPLPYLPDRFFDRLITRTRFDPTRDALAPQLQAQGIDPGSIGTILTSHLHYDHAGGLRDFPQAKVLIHRLEWEHAIRQGGGSGYITAQYPAEELRLQLFDLEPAAAFSGFSRAFDIWGDGLLRVVDLPGHTPGHVGLWVTLPSGKEMLFCGDAVYFHDGIIQRRPRSRLWQRVLRETPATAQSLETLARLHEQEPELLIIPSHDREIPGRLELAPTWYG